MCIGYRHKQQINIDLFSVLADHGSQVCILIVKNIFDVNL